MAATWDPTLVLTDVRGRCRLSLAGCAHGHGDTLQTAADDLLRNVLDLAARVRAGAASAGSTDLPRVDPRALALMHELAWIAEQGGDVRGRLLGVATPPARAPEPGT